MAALPTPPPAQQAFNNPPQRQGTQPPFTVGIAAGAEDVKYQAKYKDLKRKVKEIEADNDKLHFKVLQAKRSIQRMKLERAVLYERLQQVPPSPEMRDSHALPPVHPSPGMQHNPPQQHHPIPPNHIDRTPPEYIRTHSGNIRQDSRGTPMDSPLAPGALPHRRGSASGPEPRQLQFMQHLPPVQQDTHPHRGHAQIHSSPHMQHPSASHERSPSRTRSGHPAPPIYHPQYPDVQQQPQAQQHPLHSPPLSDRSSRRHELHELTPRHGHHQNSIPPLSPSSDARVTRSGGGIHNHQRMGPGTYVNRDELLERDRDWDRDRERGRPRDTAHMRAPQRNDYPPEPHARRRDEPAPYYAERRPYSRSNSVGSASGSGSVVEGPSRPDSRGPQYYDAPDRERDRGAPRSFRLRPVAQTEEVDFVHEDGRQGAPPPPHASSSSSAPSQQDRNGSGGGYAPPEQAQGRPPLDGGSRKRSRNDMDVDDGEDGPPGGGSGGVYARHSDAEPRGSKRYHPSSDRM